MRIEDSQALCKVESTSNSRIAWVASWISIVVQIQNLFAKHDLSEFGPKAHSEG